MLTWYNSINVDWRYISRIQDTLAKSSKSEPVSMDILGRVCKELNYNVDDIMEYINEEKTMGE
ncbi:MAG: hypothetical protein R3Y09_11355 [Clostridia bacterium]